MKCKTEFLQRQRGVGVLCSNAEEYDPSAAVLHHTQQNKMLS